MIRLEIEHLKGSLMTVERRYDQIFYIILGNMGINIIGFLGLLLLNLGLK